MKFAWPIFLLIVFLGTAQAQEPVIAPDTPVSSTMLDEWLHSGDPRLVAWAADFARRNHDATVLADMPAMLESWPSDIGNSGTPAERRSAMLAVLDALVQERFPTRVQAIESIAASFPAQAALLIAAQPMSESRTTLERWYLGNTGDAATARTLARIAAMMLAKDAKSSTASSPGPVGFVVGIVAASENQLEITITDKNGVGAGIGGGSCGDSIGQGPRPGWPEVYFYYLEEHSSNLEKGSLETGATVVELDDDRIVAPRRKEGQGWGSCYGIEQLDSVTRHRIIAYWLGVHDQDVPWHPIDNFTIVWTDLAAHNRRLGEIVESQRRKLRATIEQLQQQGLLTEEEASHTTPKLVLKIHCNIEPCPI